MISIIIPIFNQHDMTYECIQAIREHTQDCEIILIDNGSDPPYKPTFTGFIETTLIRNDENKGFPVAANQGIQAAKGEIIILLNNDVIVTPGWAERLTGWLEFTGEIDECPTCRILHLDEACPDCHPNEASELFSIIAPLTNYCAGMQQVTIPTYTNREDLDKEAEALAKENEGQAEEVNWVIGIGMTFKKSLYDELGPFDESLWPCSGEEIDFCLRARAAGHKVGIAGDVYVHHEGSMTFKAMVAAGAIDYQEVVARNEKHLAEKWGGDIWQNQAINGPKQVGVGPGLRLNLGCGQYKLKGFVNIDQFANVDPDLVADATGLPYDPDTVDEIYCGHMLEHLTWDEGQNALKHWLSILKPGGVIRIVVPNFDVLARNYFDNPTPMEMKKLNDYFIFSYVQDSLHRYCYSAGLLKAAMVAAGFTGIEPLPSNHPYYADPVDWQAGFKGVKS